MIKKKILFIYNPQAGKGKIKKILSNIIVLLNKNYEVVIYSTKFKQDAEAIVKECLMSQKYEYVVCSGGDGTLHEVINGIMSCCYRPKIGYIPSGTMNDYAYSLKVPRNMLKAARLVLDENLFSCDIGLMNDRYFAYNVSFGLFTDAAYQTSQSLKNTLGRLAYFVEGIKGLSNIKAYHLELVFEDQVISEDFIYGMVANSYSVGGFRGITGENVLLNDGEFEGIFIKMPRNILDLQNIIKDLLRGKYNSGLVLALPIKNVCIISEESIPWCIDGEFGGEMQTVRIKNCREAITIAAALGAKEYGEINLR